MAGLVPAIHVWRYRDKQSRGCRHKAGHDTMGATAPCVLLKLPLIRAWSVFATPGHRPANHCCEGDFWLNRRLAGRTGGPRSSIRAAIGGARRTRPPHSKVDTRNTSARGSLKRCNSTFRCGLSGRSVAAQPFGQPLRVKSRPSAAGPVPGSTIHHPVPLGRAQWRQTAPKREAEPRGRRCFGHRPLV
jgi:hypothetical protein